MDLKLGYKVQYVEEVCKMFGVAYRQRGWFDLKNGYALWFPHCDDESKNDWKNKISDGGRTIIEKNAGKSALELLETNKRDYSEKRITFAKKNDGMYHFVGIFEINESATKSKDQMTYRRISSEYPESKGGNWLWLVIALVLVAVVGAAAYFLM